MSPKKIEKVNYHFFGRLLLFCLFGGYYSYKRPVMVFGVGSNLGLGALGSRLAGRLSPEEERQVAEWGEEWVRGLAEWRDDPWIDVGTSRAEMMCRDALLIPSSFWWCCSFSFRLFLVGLEVQRIHSFMGFQPCPTNIYIYINNLSLSLSFSLSVFYEQGMKKKQVLARCLHPVRASLSALSHQAARLRSSRRWSGSIESDPMRPGRHRFPDFYRFLG